MFAGTLQITLFVGDVIRSVEFYRDVLGFEFMGYWDHMNREIVDEWYYEEPPDYAEVWAGVNRIGLRPSEGGSSSGTVECSLKVENVDIIYSRACENGLDVPEPVEHERSGRTLTVKDPDGHIWHLFQRPSE